MATNFSQVILIKAIQCYRFAISSLLGPCCCRFQPSCSTYALEAIREYGCFKGIWVSLKRILCCNPWHAGGWDPVPRLPKKSIY